MVDNVKNSEQGTPKNLMTAIINGLVSGPLNKAPENLEAHIKDYLSQGLTKASFKYENSPEALEAIQYLTAIWGTAEKRKPTSPLVAAVLTGDVQTIADQLGLRKTK